MADLNKVMLIGRLTRDPQLRYTPANQAVCDFGLATGRKYRTASGEEREESTFIDCTVWAKGAEIFNQYMRKGKQVFIEGRLKLDQWDDKQTGQKRSKLTVVVDNFQFLGGRDEGGGGAPHAGDEEGGGRSYSRPGGYGGNSGGGGGGGGGSRSAAPRQNQPAEELPYGNEQSFKDEDIPF